MHGLSWYLPLEPSGVVGPLQLPINWLDFLAIYGNFVIFGPSVPVLHSRRLLQLTRRPRTQITFTWTIIEYSIKVGLQGHQTIATVIGYRVL